MDDVPQAPTRPRWPALLVLAAAVLVAGWAYARFWPDARHLWHLMSHDRNAHFRSAQTVALDLRNLDPVHVVRDLERLRIWGPLYPFTTGLWLAVGGPDYRLAVLPAVAAWVGAAWLAFLTVRRVAPGGGDLAGVAAALFVLGSPAYQAFATDIMLEGPGAFLSLAVLYTYVRARQDETRAAVRWLALSLTLLFFLKSNYWVLAAAAVCATELARHLGDLRRFAGAVRPYLTGPAVRAWVIAQLRHPLTYVLLAVAALLAVYGLRGPFVIPAGSRGLPIRTPNTVATVLVWLLVLRVLPWWVRDGRMWAARLSTWAPVVVAWHVWPVVVWFMLPKRLALFVEYLTRDHGRGPDDGTLPSRAVAYARILADDYHPGWTALAIVGGLTVVAVLFARRLRPGGAVVLWFVAVSATLTLLQPTCRDRFVHSWFAAVWVAAGIGLGCLLYGWLPDRGRPVRHVLALAALGVLVALWGPAAIGPGRAKEGGPVRSAPDPLVMPEEYLPHLEGARRVAIVSNHPMKQFAQWTYQDRYRRTEAVLTEVWQLPTDPAAFPAWADREQCDAVVWVEVRKGSVLYAEPDIPDAARVPALMDAQPTFAPAGEWTWPDLGTRARLWRRK